MNTATKEARIATSQEVQSAINSMFDAKQDAVQYLWARWQDEKEYEDFSEYVAYFAKQMPEGFVVTGGSKRPFGFTFTVKDAPPNAVYMIFASGRQVGWKRVS